MTDQHPITPPLELVQQWFDAWAEGNLDDESFADYAVVRAAQWGADQELEACCEWVAEHIDHWPNGCDTELKLRAARRPKPPSLKEQALAALDDAIMRGDCITISNALPTLRRALEQLDD